MNTKTAALLFGMIVGTIGIANASQITLDPSQLPSSQGWDYEAVGLHAGTAETNIFSTDGSTLNMNSMSESTSTFTGGSISYRQYDVVGAAMPTTLEWTSRTLEYEYNASSPGQNYGFAAGFSDGSLTYLAGVSLTQVALINGTGLKLVSVDATEYHTYRIEAITGTASYNFYIDDALQTSASARYITGPNVVRFGDGTGGANANTDITALEFTQIPEPATMGLLGLFAGGIIFIRRLFIA